MGDSASTRPSLLLRLRDATDEQAWGDFVRLYGPLIYQFARNRRLQDADATDLTQLVLAEVARGIGRWDYRPRPGSFRAWLFQIVRRQLFHFFARQRTMPRGSGDSAVQGLLENEPDRAADSDEWDQEYERRLFLWAVETVRPHFTEPSWQAFWLTAVDGQSAQEAAQRLHMTVGAVYTAKSRVLDRLRAAIQAVQSDELQMLKGTE